MNNLPLYIGVGIMLVVAMNRSNQQNAAVNDEKIRDVESANLLAAMITGDFKDGIIESETQPPTGHDIPQEIIIARPPDNLELPLIPRGGEVADYETNPDAAHIRVIKLQQFEEAVKAGTNVAMVAPRSAASSPNNSGAPGKDEMLSRLAAVRQQIDVQTNEDPTATYQAKLQQIRDNGIGDEGEGEGYDSAPQLLGENSNQPTNNFARFDAEGDCWNLDSQPKAPASPYSLFPGFVIPAVFISGIDSDLPGQIMAQISQDIYDTPVGKHRLIPQVPA